MSIPLTEYMYCAQHGGFKYSDKFIEEYEKRYEKPMCYDHNEYIVDKLKRTDPNDTEAITALIQEASAGPVHKGENMRQEKKKYWYDSPWSSVITKESHDTQIETDDRVYFYAAPRTRDHAQTECQDIINVLKRLTRKLQNTEHPDKHICLAIGGIDISKATAMLVECAINFDTRFELLRGLPLYYVDLDNTERYVSSKNAFTSTDTDYDSSIF